MQFRGDIPTPALLLDLDAFESNIATMAAHLKARGKAFRPHGKTHKCPGGGARADQRRRDRLLRGASSEAEVFADARHSRIADHHGRHRPRQDRARHRPRRPGRRTPSSSWTMRQNVRDINDAAGTRCRREPVQARDRSVLRPHRHAATGEPAVELAQFIDSLPNVALRRPAVVRRRRGPHDALRGAPVANQRLRWPRRLRRKAMIERAGIACPLVTGGSTGTYRFDSENPGMTELQPGSFVFMDIEYGQIGGPDGPEYRDFKNSLTVVTTVVSRPPGIRDRRWRLQGVLDRSPVHAAAGGLDGRHLRMGGRRARPARSVAASARQSRSAIASSSSRRTSIRP